MSDSRWRETSQRVQVFSSSADTGLLSVNPLLCLDKGLIVEVEVNAEGAMTGSAVCFSRYKSKTGIIVHIRVKVLLLFLCSQTKAATLAAHNIH